MSIERNKVEKPKWGPFEYGTLSGYDVFSEERWKQTVEWDKLMDQAEQINFAVSLLVKAPYPTRLFLSYIDILDANIYIFGDLFYYLTGGLFTDGISNTGTRHDETWERLQFWNIDCHETIQKIAESLYKSQNTLRNILQRDELMRVKEMLDSYCDPDTEELLAKNTPEDESAYHYIREIYGVQGINEFALAQQINDILIFLQQDADFMFQWAQGWYSDCFLLDDFTSLLAKFVNSERGRKIVKGWEHELNGTREDLIVSLEREKKYQPWVRQYCHLSDKNNIIHELFADNDCSLDIDYKKLNNTDNWINILSIAAILQEYDKLQIIVNALKPFFNNEMNAKSFYERIKGAEPKTITALVKKLAKDNIISDKGKSLYTVLHNNDLYAPTYQNWNEQT